MTLSKPEPHSTAERCRVCTRAAPLGACGRCELCQQWQDAQAAIDSGVVTQEHELQALRAYLIDCKRQCIAAGGALTVTDEELSFAVLAPKWRAFGTVRRPPTEKRVPVSVRLTPAQRDKLYALGRDWLIARLDAEPDPAPRPKPSRDPNPWGRRDRRKARPGELPRPQAKFRPGS